MINLKVYNSNSSSTLSKNGDFPFRSILSQEIPTLATSSKNIIIVGIGGSDLGTRAIFDAILHPYNNEIKNKKFYFAGDTTDPDQVNSIFESINLSESLFIFVSKSGKTIEQNIFLKVTVDRFSVENVDYHDRIIFITDSNGSQFSEIAENNGFHLFPIPEEVGGRFSVLTNVGFVPSAIFGIDNYKLIEGASDLDKYFLNSDDDFISQYTQFKFDEYQKGKNISVMMPYKYSLKSFAKWYQQLWAESLGKNGKGQTPIAMLGPVDQHSQLQLMNDGPDDKFITIIKVLESNKNILTSDARQIEELGYLSSRDLNSVLNVEADVTIETLVKAGRPVAVLEIPNLDEYHLGQLFYFFMLSTALFGQAMGIDPYNQPGVEENKTSIDSSVRNL